MSTDPTGAARTALERLVAALYEADIKHTWVEYEDLAKAALAHLAGQAGPEVRGLVDAFESCHEADVEVCRADSPATVEARTALLAAYAAKDAELAHAVAALRADEDGPDDDLVGLSLIWIGGEEMHDRFLAWYKPEDWPLGRHRAASAFLREELAALRQQRLWCSVCNDQLDGKADICEVCAQTLRQQRDEAVARANEAEDELAKAHDFGEAQRDKAASERQRADRAEAAIAFLRDGYSSYGARACPACVYENGKFIRLCKVHEEAASERQRADNLKHILDCGTNALTDSIMASGNDANTNMHWVRKMRREAGW